MRCRHDQLLREVTIALVGKYTQLEDAYASVIKALQHSALCVSHRLNLRVGVGFIHVILALCVSHRLNLRVGRGVIHVIPALCVSHRFSLRVEYGSCSAIKLFL